MTELDIKKSELKFEKKYRVQGFRFDVLSFSLELVRASRSEGEVISLSEVLTTADTLLQFIEGKTTPPYENAAPHAEPIATPPAKKKTRLKSNPASLLTKAGYEL